MKKANLVILFGLLSIPGLLSAQPANPVFSGAEHEGSKGMSSASDTEATDANHSLDTPPTTVDKKNRTTSDAPGATATAVIPATSTAPADTAIAEAPATPAPEKAIRLNSTALAEQIRQQPADSRATLLSGLDTRLESSEREVAQIKRSSTGFSGTARETFDASFADFKTAQKALKHSLRAAHAASATQWITTRTTLAHDFEAYSLALAKVEANAAIDR